MDDLQRLPSVTRIHFLECSGNTSREWKAPVSKTVQISHGLLSNCEWTADAVMNAETLPKVQMPNRNGFTSDPRPDVANLPCKTDCN